MADVKSHSTHNSGTLSHTEAITDFSIKLFKEGFTENGNTLIAPLSVACALAMTANGASGNTLDEMESALGLDTESLNSFVYSYTNSLPTSDSYKLNLANSIWFTDDSRFTVNDTFLQINADYYGADIYKSPFDNSTVNDINAWVKDKTDGMIKKIIENIPDDAVMYLINALAFDAEWENVYYDHQIRNGIFTKSDGTKQHAAFMYSDEYSYIEDESATGFIKYYDDRAYAFVALLPNEDVSIGTYVSTLNGEKVASLLSDISSESVKTAIPKFEFYYSTEMSSLLKNLGISDAFDQNYADFGKLGSSSAGNIFINRVIHKTYIAVNERGTRAGAATLVEMADGATAVFEEPKKVYLDRPFVFMIIDNENRLPIFIGTVTDVK